MVARDRKSDQPGAAPWGLLLPIARLRNLMDSWRSTVPVMGHVGGVGFAVERQNKAQPRLGQINACLALADSVDSGTPWNPSRHNEKTLCSKTAYRCAGGQAAVEPWGCHGRLVTALVPRGRSRFMSGDAKGNTARNLSEFGPGLLRMSRQHTRRLRRIRNITCFHDECVGLA